MGLGLAQYIPFIVYLGFWVAIIISLVKSPVFGLYYAMPFVPYRALRDYLLPMPMGANMLTALILAVIVGALIHGKRPPKSRLYLIWLVFGVYLYFSMWLGVVLVHAPPPIWLSDVNFVTWKDYMVLPLLFMAAGMVIEDRQQIRRVLLILAFTLLVIDRSSLRDSLSHTWTSFDEDKRGHGPLVIGSNETAAFFAQFTMFFWGLLQFTRTMKTKLLGYALVAVTLMAAMYCFSRAAYLALVACVILLGILKDRKLLVVMALFLVTWQTVVPTAVVERVTMTHNQDGQLESSAEERVELWTNAEQTFLHNPIFGTGFATFQMGEHVDNLKDTHNWFVKVLVETGIVGGIFALLLLQGMFAIAIRLYRRAQDPLFRGLGLGTLLCLCSLVIANCFGDRWTYLEINGLLWIVLAAVLRALQLAEAESAAVVEEPAALELEPSMGWRSV